MTSRNTLAAAVWLLMISPWPSVAQTRGDDRALDSRIEARMKSDPALKHHPIRVDVDHGVVTLKGKVASEADRTRALTLAQVTGVRRVDNTLTVDASLARKAVSAEKARGTSQAVAGDVADVVTDAWLITRLKAEFLGDAALEGSDIDVDADHHVVTLKGTVATEAGRSRAVQVAKTTKGVTQVVDALTVGPKR